VCRACAPAAAHAHTLIVWLAACGRLWQLRGCGASSLEVCGAATVAHLQRNELLDGKSGVGALFRDGGAQRREEERPPSPCHLATVCVCRVRVCRVRVCRVCACACAAAGRFDENTVRGHPLGGVEVSEGACPTIARNRISACGVAGVLLGSEARGELRDNEIFDNLRHGIECCSAHAELRIEQNMVKGQRRGTGVLVRGGGGGSWVGNTITNNLCGVQCAEGATPTLLRNKIHANMREGLSVGDGAVADVVENTLRANGNERVVRASGSRRGQRIHGDDAGSRPAPRDTSAATLAATLPIALPAPQPAA
jgi:hypothetical protein